jgi:hypothetical protein
VYNNSLNIQDGEFQADTPTLDNLTTYIDFAGKDFLGTDFTYDWFISITDIGDILQITDQYSNGFVYTITGLSPLTGNGVRVITEFVKKVGKEFEFDYGLCVVSVVKNLSRVGQLHLEGTTTISNQGIAKWPIPLNSSDLVFNELPEITITNFTIGNSNGCYFSGFIVGKIYNFYCSCPLTHTTAGNRVVRMTLNTTTGTPISSNGFVATNINSIFGQSSLFGNVCWTSQLVDAWECQTAGDKVWVGIESDLGTIAVGGVAAQAICQITITRA